MTITVSEMDVTRVSLLEIKKIPEAAEESSPEEIEVEN